MKKLAWLLLVTLSPTSFAAMKPTDRQDLPIGVNLLANSGFENGKAKWTNSGGTFAIVNSGSSSLLFDSASATFTASATAQYVETSLFTPQYGLDGQPCVGSIYYKGGSTSYELEVLDGSNNILARSGALAVSTTSKQVFTSAFSCAQATPVKLRLVSSASGALIALDGASLGSSPLISQVSQAQFYGSVKTPLTASCTWNRASSSYGSFTAVSACPVATASGQASAPATKIPAITFASMPAGHYRFYVSGTWGDGNASSTYMRMHDGTSFLDGENSLYTPYTSGGATPVSIFEVTYASPQSNKTIEIQMKATASTAFLDATGNDVLISVDYFPSQSQTVANISGATANWSGYISGCSFVNPNGTAFSEFTVNNSCTLTQQNNVNFGSVSIYNSSGNLPGFTFTPPSVGSYYVCAATNMGQSITNHYGSLELSDTAGPTVIAQQNSSGGTLVSGVTLCGVYNASTLSSKTIRLRAATDSASAHAQLFDGAGLGVPGSAVFFSIVNITSNLPSPFIQPSLTKSSVWVSNGNGYGSTATKRRRFTTIVESVGTGITYADSSTNGGTFTINNNSVCDGEFLDYNTGATGTYLGFALNATGTTDINSLTPPARLDYQLSGGTNQAQGKASFHRVFTAGDVVDCHGSSGQLGNGTDDRVYCRITCVY